MGLSREIDVVGVAAKPLDEARILQAMHGLADRSGVTAVRPQLPDVIRFPALRFLR